MEVNGSIGASVMQSGQLEKYQKETITLEATRETCSPNVGSTKKGLNRFAKNLQKIHPTEKYSPIKHEAQIGTTRCSPLAMLGKSLSLRSISSIGSRQRDAKTPQPSDECSETVGIERSRSFKGLDALDGKVEDCTAQIILEVDPNKAVKKSVFSGMLSSPAGSCCSSDGSNVPRRTLSSTLRNVPRRTMSVDSMNEFDPLLTKKSSDNLRAAKRTPSSNLRNMPRRTMSVDSMNEFDPIFANTKTATTQSLEICIVPQKDPPIEIAADAQPCGKNSCSHGPGVPVNMDSLFLPLETNTVDNRMEANNHLNVSRHLGALPQVSEEASLASQSSMADAFYVPTLPSRPRNMQHRAVSQDSLLSLGCDSLCSTVAVSAIQVPDLASRGGGSIGTLDYDHPSIGIENTRFTKDRSPRRQYRTSVRKNIRRVKSHNCVDMLTIARLAADETETSPDQEPRESSRPVRRVPSVDESVAEDCDDASLYSIHNDLLEKKPLMKRLGNSFRRNSLKSSLPAAGDGALSPIKSPPQRIGRSFSFRRQTSHDSGSSDIKFSPSSPIRSPQRRRPSFTFRRWNSQASMAINGGDSPESPAQRRRRASFSLRRLGSVRSILTDTETKSPILPGHGKKEKNPPIDIEVCLVPQAIPDGCAVSTRFPAAQKKISRRSSLSNLPSEQKIPSIQMQARKRPSFRFSKSKSLMSLSASLDKSTESNRRLKDIEIHKTPPRPTMFRRASARLTGSQRDLSDLEKPTVVKAERLEERKSALARLGGKLRRSFSQRAGRLNDTDTISAGFTMDFTMQTKEKLTHNRNAMLAPAIARKRGLLRPLKPEVRTQVPESLLVDMADLDDISSLGKQSHYMGSEQDVLHVGVPSTIVMDSVGEIDTLDAMSDCLSGVDDDFQDNTDNALIDMATNLESSEGGTSDECDEIIAETQTDLKVQAQIVAHVTTATEWEKKYRMAILETEALRAILDSDRKLTDKLEDEGKKTKNKDIKAHIRKKRQLEKLVEQTSGAFSP